jgi:hypothetical protein
MYAFTRTCHLLLLLLLTASGAQAEVYRWVDDQGQVHFEDRSRSQSAGGSRSYAPPAATVDNNTPQRMEKTRKLLNAYQEERRQAREQKDKQQEQQKKRAQQCARARDNLRQYERYGSIYRLDETGKRVYLSDGEREALIKRSRDDIARWCS